MTKSVTKRVAKSGKRTADGRSISKQWLEDAAKSYDLETYAALVFLEHIRGLYPDSIFKVYGTVIKLSLEDAGDGEVYLVAEIEPHPELETWWQDGQKRAFSIEIIEDFADLHCAYLSGLAVTDSPASLGTHFTRKFSFDPESNNPSQCVNDTLTLQDNNMAINAEQFTESLKHFSAEIDGLRTERDMLKAKLVSEVQKFSDTAASQEAILAAAQEKYTTDIAEKDEEISALKEQIPAANFTHRPIITGGEGSTTSLIY